MWYNEVKRLRSTVSLHISQLLGIRQSRYLLWLLIKCLFFLALHYFFFFLVWMLNKVDMHMCTCVTALCVFQLAVTCAGELLWRRREQQFVGHVTRTRTAGYARLLVAALYPVWQPLHVAVTVQRVGPESPASRNERERRGRTMFSYNNAEQSTL